MIQLAHSIIREQIRKYKAGYKSPGEIDNALYRGLLDFYNSLDKSDRDSQQLSWYLFEMPCNISGSNSFTLPATYGSPAAIYSIVSGARKEGDILAENEYLDRIQSLIIPPTLTRPVARIIGKQIEFYPSDAGNFVFSYYRAPVEPVWNYTVAANGRDLIYNPTGSIELDVNPPSLNNVIVRAMGYLGVSLKDESLLLERQINGN
jgi:hypothetical protein